MRWRIWTGYRRMKTVSCQMENEQPLTVKGRSAPMMDNDSSKYIV